MRILDQLWTCSFLQRCSAEIDKCFSIFCDIVWYEQDYAEWADGPTSKVLGRQLGTGPHKIFWFKVSESPECHKSPYCFICIFGEVVRKAAVTNINGRSQWLLECSGTDRWGTLQTRVSWHDKYWILWSSLHNVHGAFKSGMETSEWNLAKALQGDWQLFHDSPAQRDTYILICERQDFPCGMFMYDGMIYFPWLSVVISILILGLYICCGTL